MGIKGTSKDSPRTQSAPTLKSTPRAQGTSKEGKDTRGAQSVREGFSKVKLPS